MKFAIKGDSEDKAQELYKFAGRNVKMSNLLDTIDRQNAQSVKRGYILNTDS